MTKPGPKTLRDVRVRDVSREAEGILGFEKVPMLFDFSEIGVVVIETVGPITT